MKPATLPERATVLIVDDDPLSIEVLAEALDGEYDIRFATSGEQALQILDAENAADGA